jgi:hypothetical protein
MLSFEDWLDVNYDLLKDQHREFLINECWYAVHVANNCDDWRDTFVEDEYQIYREWFTSS